MTNLASDEPHQVHQFAGLHPSQVDIPPQIETVTKAYLGTHMQAWAKPDLSGTNLTDIDL